VQIPEQFGGGGQSSFKFNAVLTEEAFRACTGLGSMRVHMDIVLPYVLYFATEDQRQRWLPGMASGQLMTSIAMTNAAPDQTWPVSPRRRVATETHTSSTVRRRLSPEGAMPGSSLSLRAHHRQTSRIGARDCR
jgi:hypothetical protein